MFGSNFAQQFGLFGPPWDNLDSYGGMFAPNAPEQPLPGSELLGEQLRAGPGAQQPPAQGMPGVQQPRPPDQTGTSAQPRPDLGVPLQEHLPVTGAMNPAGPLSQGPLAAGVNSEFGRG